MSEEEKDGDRPFTLLLLKLYRKAPELWNVQTKQYYDKDKKALAITKIMNELKSFDRNFTEDDFKKKINKLRTCFNREVRKVKKSIKSGSEKVFKPKLWYFNEMNFLLDSDDIEAMNRPGGVVVKVDPSEDKSDGRKIKGFYKRKKKKMGVQVELLTQTINKNTSYLKKEEDEYDAMSRVWATQMRQLSDDQKIFAQKVINDVLFEAAMGTLTRHGVRFLPDASSMTPFNIPNHSCSYDSTYTSPIPPQSPVTRTCSPPDDPLISSSPPEIFRSPEKDHSEDLSQQSHQEPQTDTDYDNSPVPPDIPIVKVEGSSVDLSPTEESKIDEFSIEQSQTGESSMEQSQIDGPSIEQSQIDESTIANISSESNKESRGFPHSIKCYMPHHKSARTTILKKSTKSIRAKVLRQSLISKQIKSTALIDLDN